jgi:hypothetical protein
LAHTRTASRCAFAFTLALLTTAAISAQAQPANTKTAATPTKPPAPATPKVASYGRGATQLRIESVLNQKLKTPLSAVETPVNMVLREIAEDYDIPIIFDTDALKSAGLTPEQEVTLSIANVTLKSALQLILNNASDGKVASLITDDVLLITSRAAADNHLETRIYPVQRLLTALRAGQGIPVVYDDQQSPPNVATELADALVLTVAPDSWRRNGSGRGDLQKIGDKYLVVLQTQSAHEEIEKLLKTLSTAAATDAPAARPQATNTSTSTDNPFGSF